MLTLLLYLKCSFIQKNTAVIKKLDLRYVNVIIISAKNGRLTYVINQFGFVNI